MSDLLNPINFPNPKSIKSESLGLVIEQRITSTSSDESRIVEVYAQNRSYLIKLVRNLKNDRQERHSFVLDEHHDQMVDRTIPIRYFLERTPLILDEEAWVIEDLAARIHYLIALHKNRSK